MYNLLVCGNSEAWKGAPYELEMGRVVREYTADAISKRFADLSDDSVVQLQSFPALFAYESGHGKPARIGWITRIRHRSGTVRVEYEIDDVLPEIPSDAILQLRWDLDVTDWEMNRTHWAVKDVDLFPVLMEAGILDPALIRAQPKTSKIVKLGLEQRVTEIEARPIVFRIPDKPSEAGLVSAMMPFSNAFDDVYKALQTGCEVAGFRCERADNVWEESEVVQDIFSLIYRSEFVICDFSGANPNVFYEAGIAHTLGRVVIPIAQNSDDVPFDLRHHRYIRYLNNGEGREGLSHALAKRLSVLRTK